MRLTTAGKLVCCSRDNQPTLRYIEGEVEEFPTFDATDFRPVKETDISIFTAMLAPTPKQKVGSEA
jgi:hypothetical protein